MKRILTIILFLFTFIFSANVKPFYFENISNDSVSQQNEWETLMRYKVFGAYELTFGNELIRITDKSGWIGTSKGNFTLGQNGKDTLGGPIIVGGNLTLNNGPAVFSTGPLHVNGDLIVTQTGFKDRNNIFNGYQCIKGNVDPLYAKFVSEDMLFYGTNYENCPIKLTHPNDTALIIPKIYDDSINYVSIMDLDSTQNDNIINNETATIIVPRGSYKETYDIYLDNLSFMNNGKLVVKQQQGGRLTRIFIKNGLSFSSHTKIVVAYCDETNNCNELNNDDYSGTLLFYSLKSFNFPAFDLSTSLQGSFISYESIKIAHHLILSGQVLANNLSIDTDFDGSNFIFVPFDQVVLDFDPTALAGGKFIENDIPSKINVHLDTLALTDVFFNYCFILNKNVTLDDFNNDIPVCNEDDSIFETDTILRGTKNLTHDIYLNVKIDNIIEGDEKFEMRIFNLSGAVLPGNVHKGSFVLTLTDGIKINTKPVIDTTYKIPPYNEEQLIPPGSGIIGKINVIDDNPKELKYELIGNDFFFIENDGTIITNKVFDYETEDTVYTVLVKVSDNEYIDSVYFDIKIKNIQEPISVNIKLTDIYEGSVDSIGGVQIGQIIGKDADSTKVFYELKDNTNTFIINKETGIISINKDIDYETKKEYPINVIIKSEDGSIKDTSFVINIKNINEPVHIKDTTFTISENKIGEIGKVTAWDEDNDKIIYFISDTSRYDIDDIGNITVKVPFDYENQKTDDVWVFVKDPNGLIDSAKITIKIKNELETSKVEIIVTETRDSLWMSDTVYTNSPDIKIDWTADDKLKFTDTTIIPGTNIIELCYQDPSKDDKACDKVVILYSKEPPVVTVAKVEENKTSINGITIVEEKDKNDSNIYVNKKNNEIEVTVKDQATNESEKFKINIELDTFKINNKNFENYGYIVDINKEDLKYTIIDDNKIKYSEIINVDGQDITLYYYGDTTGKPLDTLRYVEYIKKIDNQEIKFTYKTNDLGIKISDYEIEYEYKDEKNNSINISYTCDENGNIIKNTNESIGYKVSYTYTNKYGNSATSSIFIEYSNKPPKVEIITPTNDEIYYNNSTSVKWTVDGVEQDTLNLERLNKGFNNIIRMYKDKYGNIGSDTIYVIMKNAKDIDIVVINPVTEIDKSKVDKYYSNNSKYDEKTPVQILIKDPKSDTLPETIGVGFKITIVLPSLNSTGGLATIDDMLQTINGNTGILVDKNGNLKSGTSTGADGSYTINTEKYIEEHCTEEFKKEYKKYGIEHTTIWNVKYKMHIWIFTNTANYVNDFDFEYILNDTNLADEAGILTMVVDWLSSEDGLIKSKNKKAIGTGVYLTKLEAISISTSRCDLPEQPIGTKIKNTEYNLTTFGYKRPIK